MNTKDFVVLPWGKPGHSVKLKYKHAQELRMEKVQLELENQEMEKKLQEFQSTWNKQREEAKSNGYHWKSGKVDKLRNQSHIMSQNKGNATMLTPGKVKLKPLKQQIHEPIKHAVNYTVSKPAENKKPKIKGRVCGQCEKKTALLVCVECGEDYCSECFANIHQKGALRLHRTNLLQAKSQILSSVLDVAHRFIKEVNPDESNEGNNSTEESNKSQQKPKPLLPQGSSSEVEITTTNVGECANPRVRLLCEGTFDEAASARSFQEALSHWRSGIVQDNKEQSFHEAKPDSLEECEVQTNLKIWTEPINIEFKEDSLSYMEKLWLKKHRRIPQEQPGTFLHSPANAAATAEVQASQNESEDDSDVEVKVKYPPLFMPVEESKIERPEPSLTIIELDDTYEDQCEETGNAVPYKVELADSETQLSGICHHHVFDKGRLDVSHLCLGSSHAYYKDDLKAGNSYIDFDNTADSGIDPLDNENVAKSSSSEGNVKEKNTDPENIQQTCDPCVSLGSKDSSPTTNLDTTFIKQLFSRNTQESSEFANLPEKLCPKDSKTTKSPPLLQEIALRNKPVNETYQGPESFFTFNQNERQSLESSHSCSKMTLMTLAEDREWMPEHSVSVHADGSAAFPEKRRAENPPPRVRQQRVGQKSRRPSTASLPLSNSVKKDSSCFPSPRLQSRSAAAQSLSRAASEISEIEYLDSIDQCEPSLDHAADQQTLDSLEKELNVLSSFTNPFENLSSLSTEELPTLKHNSLNVSQRCAASPLPQM